MYKAVTEGVEVTVQPTFLSDQSAPEEHRWVWAYAVEIRNTGEDTVQLRTRHWTITDANGHTEEVHGPGVVGEQPTLPPGGSYRYTSGCPLATPSGFMVGQYEMERSDGDRFRADIPAFSLDLPDEVRTVN